MLITSSLVLDFLILLTLLVFLLYKYSTRQYDYFKKRNIYYIKPIPFFGNMWPVISTKMSTTEWLSSLYHSIDEPYFGIFVLDEPKIVIKSPKLIKHILVTDFNKFADRSIVAPKHDKIMYYSIFVQKYSEWKKIRKEIIPLFSSTKLKGMFLDINQSGIQLSQYISKNLGKLDAKEFAVKYAIDVLAKCIFAVNAHSFEDNNRADFLRIGTTFFKFTLRNVLVQSTYFLKPKWASALRLEFFQKWAVNWLKDILLNIIKKRQEIGIGKGNDLIDILLEISKKGSNEFDIDIMLSQGMTLFAAGFDATSSILSFTLYELCLQPHIQEKVRREVINNINEHSGITYEGLKNLEYMDMCLYEALRKYPMIPFLDRKCNEDYHLPGTDLIIEKDKSVFISVWGLHYDENYFPTPSKYDPERFVDRKTYNVNGLCYLPFGEGPRICMGERFAMIILKTALSYILSEFVVERIPETPVPLEFEIQSLLLQTTGGIPLGFKKLN